jgi:hypothetical protein
MMNVFPQTIHADDFLFETTNVTSCRELHAAKDICEFPLVKKENAADDAIL